MSKIMFLCRSTIQNRTLNFCLWSKLHDREDLRSGRDNRKVVRWGQLEFESSITWCLPQEIPFPQPATPLIPIQHCWPFSQEDLPSAPLSTILHFLHLYSSLFSAYFYFSSMFTLVRRFSCVLWELLDDLESQDSMSCRWLRFAYR